MKFRRNTSILCGPFETAKKKKEERDPLLLYTEGLNKAAHQNHSQSYKKNTEVWAPPLDIPVHEVWVEAQVSI